MACCGKQRARFLNKRQQQIERDKRAETPKIIAMVDLPDELLTPIQKRAKLRILRKKRREARALRIAKRNARAEARRSNQSN
jgi:hypothetical protein